MGVSGRPGISNCDTPTEKISEFVDFYLQPILKSLPYVIKDPTDFLYKLGELGDISDGTIICNMDAVGLYPYIPHNKGLLSMRESLEGFEEFLADGRIAAGDLIDLAKVILENNFEFEDKVSRQKFGTEKRLKRVKGSHY